MSKKQIYTTEKERKQREQQFVMNPKRLKKLEAITNEIIEDITDRLVNDNYLHFHWGKHTLHIEFDRYHYKEYSIVTDSINLWIANGRSNFSFYEDVNLSNVLPGEKGDKLWKVVNDVKQAQKARLTYKEYIKHKDDAKTQAEIKKAEEIAKAKEVLEKYNASS